jgi:hypothetical protein
LFEPITLSLHSISTTSCYTSISITASSGIRTTICAACEQSTHHVCVWMAQAIERESCYRSLHRAWEAVGVFPQIRLRATVSSYHVCRVEQGHHAGDVKQMGGSSKYDLVESDDDEAPSAQYKSGEGLVGSLAEGAPPPSTLAPVCTALPGYAVRPFAWYCTASLAVSFEIRL